MEKTRFNGYDFHLTRKDGEMNKANDNKVARYAGIGSVIGCMAIGGPTAFVASAAMFGCMVVVGLAVGAYWGTNLGLYLTTLRTMM